jgi:hypothetical protein
MKALAGMQLHLFLFSQRVARRAILFLGFFTFLALSHGAFSQVTTQGTDFYVTFGSNYDRSVGSLVFQIRIAAIQAAYITLTFKADGSTVNFPVSAGQVYTYNLNAAQKANVYLDAAGVSDKSLRIQSTAPVSVYALNQSYITTEATLVLPVDNLGTDYYHISYYPYSNLIRGDGYAVIATENGTAVYEDGAQKATLNVGEVYTFYAQNTDLTGRHITSGLPVACFTVNGGTLLPEGTTSDCLYEQMMPVHSWGNNFLVPVTRRGKERVRIVASQNGTAVTQTGGVIKTDGGGGAQNPANPNAFTLNAGQYAELEIDLAGGGCFISTNRPAAVASYLLGITYSGLTVANGDPSVAWVPPVEQMIGEASIAPFIPTGSTNLNEHHALVVTATATKDQTTVAIGTASPAVLSGGAWTTGVNNDFSFYSMPLTSTSGTYTFSNPNGLTVTGYRLGDHESYYYMAGAAARNLNAGFYINDMHHINLHQKQICCAGQLTLSFRADIQYIMSTAPGYLKWYINGVEETSATDVLEWNKTVNPGAYTVTMEVLDISNNRTQTLTSTVKTGPCFIPINPHLRSSVVGQ